MTASRAPRILALLLALALSACAPSATEPATGQSGEDDPAPSGAPATEDGDELVEVEGEGPELTLQDPARDPGPSSEDAEPDAGGSLGSAAEDGERLLVLGNLDEGRLNAYLERDVVAAAAGESAEFALVGRSDLVGAVMDLATLDDGRIAVVASDHRDLMVLSADWESTEAVSLDAALSPQGFLGLRTVLAIGDRVVASHDIDGASGVSTIDVDTGDLRDQRWDDVEASFPAMCQRADGVVAVAGSDRVVLADPSTLDRRDDVEAPTQILGAACLDDVVWVASAAGPELLRIGPDGGFDDTMSWDGELGSPWLVADDADHLWVSDPAALVVARCRPTAGCETSEPLPSRPASLTVSDEHVFVVNEEPGHLHVLRRDDLRTVGSIALPGGGRAPYVTSTPAG